MPEQEYERNAQTAHLTERRVSKGSADLRDSEFGSRHAREATDEGGVADVDEAMAITLVGVVHGNLRIVPEGTYYDNDA